MITINPEKLVKNATSSGELIFRGGLKLQAELGAQNVQRFANFLTTPQGKTFLLQQTILQSQNPLRDKDTGKRTTAIYNPLAPTIPLNTPRKLPSPISRCLLGFLFVNSCDKPFANVGTNGL